MPSHKTSKPNIVITEQPVAPGIKLNAMLDHAGRPRFTGNNIVMLNTEQPTSRFIKAAANTSLRLADIRDFSNRGSATATEQALSQADGVVFDTLKLAVIPAQKKPQLLAMTTRASGAKPILRSEPERFVYALPSARSHKLPYLDDETSTWGLQAINALTAGENRITGKGIKIAILDTGINMAHPDFEGRIKGSESFVPNSKTEDGNGHGTHCAGIAGANVKSGSQLRYGVAPGADLYIAKVLSNKGTGEDRYIFAAIEWALENKCHIISMSFGSETAPGETYYEAYENAAKRAFKNNCLMIVAAGNDSNRPRKIRPVNHPANCPSILAVGAVDPSLKVSYYSCGGTKNAAVDIAAPGDDIYSAWAKGKYRVESGTSMATPFVAGVAALYAQKYNHYTMRGIRSTLLRYAKKISVPVRDAGKGLLYFK